MGSFLKKTSLVTLLFSSLWGAPAQLCVGGGYYMAGCNHSGVIAQVEYKWPKTYWKVIRPQVEVLVPELKSLFVGAGIALELYVTDHIVFSPNFSPGLYVQGEGRNLGFPLEFRSCLELAYEGTKKWRFGTQFYHISNASLGDKNPGANAWTFFLGIPLCVNH